MLYVGFTDGIIFKPITFEAKSTNGDKTNILGQCQFQPLQLFFLSNLPSLDIIQGNKAAITKV